MEREEAPLKRKAALERWSTGRSFAPAEISDEEMAKIKKKSQKSCKNGAFSRGFRRV